MLVVATKHGDVRMQVRDRDVLPLPTAKKGKKSRPKKAGAKGKRATARSKGSFLARAGAGTMAATLGAGLAIGAAMGAVLGRRR